MNTWETIIASLGLSSILNLTLGYLLREWISSRIKGSIHHEYKVKEETLKSSLQTELEKKKAQLQGELEGTRAGYKKVLDENQIRFSRLYAEQAEVLKELYKKLVALQTKVKLSVTLPKVDLTEELFDEESKSIQIKVYELYDISNKFFQENRLFLPEELAKSVEIFLQDICLNFELFSAHNDRECLEQSSREDKLAAGRERRYAKDYIFSDSQHMFNEIEMEFRDILGIKNT